MLQLFFYYIRSEIYNLKLMKSIYVYVLVILMSFSAFSKAQILSDVHSPRIGDQFSKDVATYKCLPNNKARGNIWNINDIEMTGRKVPVEYIADPKFPNGIIEIENNTRYSFYSKGTELVLRAYENNLTKLTYNAPELAFSSSMFLGYRKDSIFYGDCIYSEKVFSRISGQYTYEVDGIGTLALPSGDSLHNVARVHIQKQIKQLYNNAKQDSSSVEENIYKWYALGYRYPIYETQESHVKDNSKGFTVAYYFSPESQRMLDDSENEKIREKGIGEDMQPLNEATNGTYKKHKLTDGTILSYTVKFTTDGDMSVSLSCTKGKNISKGLYTLGGITIGKISLQDVGMDEHVWHQRLHKDKSAVYLLSIIVDGQTFAEKIINK